MSSPTKSIRCTLGIHSWEYTAAVYHSRQAERLAIPTEEGYRKCKRCGKVQVEDVHCLGLNPPEYVVSYYNRKEV